MANIAGSNQVSHSAYSIDSDQMPHSVASDLSLCCLLGSVYPSTFGIYDIFMPSLPKALAHVYLCDIFVVKDVFILTAYLFDHMVFY